MQDWIKYPSAETMRKFLFIAVICFTLQLMAAEESVPTDQSMQQVEPTAGGTSEKQNDVIEEITVIGQKEILNMRQQIILAEDYAFEIFNELNDDDMYDVHCTMEASTGTLLKRRMCYPNYYHRATQARAAEYLGLIGEYSTFSPATPTVRNVVDYRHPIFKKKVKELALKNPELLDALKHLAELSEKLRESKEIYHGFENN